MAFFEDESIALKVESDAQYRAYIAMIHKAFTEVGLVQTSDTGQLNVETVTVPLANAYNGYSVWRFNDANQATEPVFFKIEFGRANSGNSPKFKVFVGTGSNGSGTITNSSGELTLGLTSTPGTTGFIYAVFKEDSFLLVSHHEPSGNATPGLTLVIERGKNPATQALQGVLIAGVSGSDPFSSIKVRAGGEWLSGSGAESSQSTAPAKAMSGVAVPGLCYVTGAPCAPCITVLSMRNGDVALSESGKVTVRGKERTYRRPPRSGSVSIGVAVNMLYLRE